MFEETGGKLGASTSIRSAKPPSEVNPFIPRRQRQGLANPFRSCGSSRSIERGTPQRVIRPLDRYPRSERFRHACHLVPRYHGGPVPERSGIAPAKGARLHTSGICPGPGSRRGNVRPLDAPVAWPRDRSQDESSSCDRSLRAPYDPVAEPAGSIGRRHLDAACAEFGSPFAITAEDLLAQFLCSRRWGKGHDSPAEAGAGESSAVGSMLLRQHHEAIELGCGDLEVVLQARVAEQEEITDRPRIR